MGGTKVYSQSRQRVAAGIADVELRRRRSSRLASVGPDRILIRGRVDAKTVYAMERSWD